MPNLRAQLLHQLKNLPVYSSKKRLLLAMVSGCFMTLALPPVYLYPALIVGFPLSAWLVAAAPTKKQSFWTGWMVGFSYFAFSLYWVSHALLVFSLDLWWLVPFAALGLPACLGLFTGLLALVIQGFKTPVLKIAAWGFAWLAAEWLRGFLFTGFPSMALPSCVM